MRRSESSSAMHVGRVLVAGSCPPPRHVSATLSGGGGAATRTHDETTRSHRVKSNDGLRATARPWNTAPGRGRLHLLYRLVLGLSAVVLCGLLFYTMTGRRSNAATSNDLQRLLLRSSLREDDVLHNTWNTEGVLRTTERVVVIGDLHGDLSVTVRALAMAGLVDRSRAPVSWAGGKAVLVQLGDVTDRGPWSGELVALMARLEGEARGAGGQVISLLGNHEALNLQGKTRYVHRRELEWWRGWGGASAREDAFTLDGALARVLKRQRAVVRINGVLFVHAGVLPHVITESGENGKSRGRRGTRGGVVSVGLAGNSTQRDPLNDTPAAPPEAATPEAATPEAATPEVRIANINLAMRRALMANDFQDRILKGSGPLWTRMFTSASLDDGRVCRLLSESLTLLGATQMVVGHTVQDDGMIKSRCGGRLIMADIGLSAWVQRKRAGTPISVLEMQGNATVVLSEVVREGVGVHHYARGSTRGGGGQAGNKRVLGDGHGGRSDGEGGEHRRVERRPVPEEREASDGERRAEIKEVYRRKRFKGLASRKA